MLTGREWLENNACSDPTHKTFATRSLRKNCLECVYLYADMKVKEATDNMEDGLLDHDWSISSEKTWAKDKEEGDDDNNWGDWMEEVEPHNLSLSEQALDLGKREESSRWRLQISEILRNLDATNALVYDLQEEIIEANEILKDQLTAAPKEEKEEEDSLPSPIVSTLDPDESDDSVCTECDCIHELHYSDDLGKGCFGNPGAVDICFCSGFVSLNPENQAGC